jgi:hypothetical protein
VVTKNNVKPAQSDMGMFWLHNPKIRMSEIFPWDLPNRATFISVAGEGNIRGNQALLVLFFILVLLKN